MRKIVHLTMDTFFTIFIVVLIALLAVVYMLSHVSRTSNLKELLELVQKERPSAIAFSLGETTHKSKRRRYRNVHWDGDRIYEKLEARPLNPNGEYVIKTDHGQVSEQTDGFKITGMERVLFKCPKGFTTAQCTMEPLCDEADHKKESRKHLTYTQFNVLNVYQHSLVDAAPQDTVMLAPEQNHPRICIQCLKDGTYELETCPNNKLLDKDLNCMAYDICEDRINGYKHNYSTSGIDARKEQYWICENNESKERECTGGSLFSMSRQGCVTQSPCYGRGFDQIWLSDKRYYQCGDDTSKIIYCRRGIVLGENGAMSCLGPPCRAYLNSEDMGVLSYYTGGVKCDAFNKRQNFKCTESKTTHTETYTWIEEVKIVVENWPNKVVDKDAFESSTSSANCIDPTDSIYKDGATKQIAWTALMSRTYPFDLRKKIYKCKTKYRWDYEYGKIYDNYTLEEKVGVIMDSAAPCQNRTLQNDDMPWMGMPVERFPERSPTITKAPAVYRVPFIQTKIFETPYRMWPIYDTETKLYHATTVCYDYSNRKFVCDTFSDDQPPLGFKTHEDIGTKQRLKLRGYPDFPKEEEDDDYMWYFIASGETEPVKFRPTAKRVTVRYNCPKKVDTNSIKDGTTAFIFIMWQNIEESKDFLLTGEFHIKRDGIRLSHRHAQASFQPLTIAKQKGKIELTYSDLSVPLVEDLELEFP